MFYKHQVAIEYLKQYNGLDKNSSVEKVVCKTATRISKLKINRTTKKKKRTLKHKRKIGQMQINLFFNNNCEKKF